jgi:hypothetical protein
VLLALLAQWMLAVASTAHHARAAAAAGPWNEVCTSAPAAPAPDGSDVLGSAGGCPVCAAAALLALPVGALQAPAVAAPEPIVVRRAGTPLRAATAPCPPARAPPTV